MIYSGSPRTRLHMHLYTGDGSPLRWSPVGAAIFCTSTCHLDHAQEMKRARQPLLSSPRCSLPLSLFPSPRFIPRRVKPASYDNSAPRDMQLTLLVESPIATVSQLSSQRLGPGCETVKRKYLNSRSYRVAHLERRRMNFFEQGTK